MENLTEILPSIHFTVADLQDQSAMRAACEGVDYVLHQAALASVPRSVRDPLTSHESNVNGTLSLLLAARDAGVKRIVLCGLIVRLWRSGRAGEARRDEPTAALALRGTEACL